NARTGEDQRRQGRRDQGLWNGGRLGAQQSRWFFRASDQTDRRAKIAGDNSAGNNGGEEVAENARSVGALKCPNWRLNNQIAQARPARHPESRQTTRNLTQCGRGSHKVARVIRTAWARSLTCAQDDKPSSRSEITREHHRR